MNTNNNYDRRKSNTMVRDLKASLFDIIVDSELDINALEQVQGNELYKELQKRYSSTLKTVISSSNGLTESMLALGKIHEEYQQLLATTQTLEQSNQYSNSPEPKQEVEEEQITYSDESTMAPEEGNENSIEQEDQEKMENSDGVAVPEETQEENTAPEQSEEDQEEMENSDGVAVPEETQEENAAPEQSEEDQEEMDNSDEVALSEVTQEDSTTPEGSTEEQNQSSEEEINGTSDAIVPIDITKEMKIDSIPTDNTVAENKENNNTDDITLTTIEDSTSSNENDNSSEISNGEKENASQDTDVVLPIINENGIEIPTEETAEIQSPSQETTPISNNRSNESTEESAVIPITDAIPKEEIKESTETEDGNSKPTLEPVEETTVNMSDVPVAIPTETTLPVPEPISNETETKEVIFVRVKGEDDKAILVNRKQAGKLRDSKEFQKKLIKSQAERQNSIPVQEDTEEQLQQMLGQLPILYEQGKTKEAEEMSDKISVLSKKLNSSIAA